VQSYAAPSPPRLRFVGAVLGVLIAGVLLVPAAARALEVPYEVQIAGVEDRKLLDTLRAVSRLIADRDRPPPTVPALRRRADADRSLLEEALASFGYYGAAVTYRIERDATPVQVLLTVALGEPYGLARYDVAWRDPAPAADAIDTSMAGLGLEAGMAAESGAIVAAERQLLAVLARRGHPLAAVLDRKVVVDHAAHTVVVDLAVDAGPFARFGAVAVEGLDSVREDFVRSQLPWLADETFDRDRVEAGRRALIRTGLFASVAIAEAPSVGPDGRLPLTLTAVEAKHRSLGAGANYSTSEGFGGKVFWEHRNLLHAGERLEVTGFGGQTVFGAATSFRKPTFLGPRNSLLLDGQFTQEDREGFDSRTAGVSAGIERNFSDTITAGAGVLAEWSKIEEDGRDDTFTLVGAPLSLRRDTTDDLLDPARGGRTTLGVTPYMSVAGPGVRFIVARLAQTAYLSLLDDDSLVLAGWGRVGSIFGEDTEAIPATKRLYGGGGGSVRAYGFQMLGPLDLEENPSGGRSQLEVGVELRYRFLEDVGVVAFFEGGNVYDDRLPDPTRNLLWGAGVGVRYFTGIGPIRLDVAVPLNGRPADAPFQIYISLGQAF